MPSGVKIHGPIRKGYDEILSEPALEFVADLARNFRDRVDELLERRRGRQLRYDRGQGLDFLPETADVRSSDWTVAELPADLQDRRVEITGPVERKMVINALNSGANVFMADFEDSNAPTWDNTIGGQVNLRDAVRKTISYDHPVSGKHYELKDKTAVLFVRARGWHLKEAHITVDGLAAPAGLVDFGLYFFHNAKTALELGTGPYFYLPKMESYLEARLWNDVFLFAQKALSIPKGTIKATVLIETLPAAFQMDEILYELRDHSAGLNCGRWDYIFSFIKTLQARPDRVLPDRSQVGMTQPFMRSYTQLAIQTCHKRNAFSMGGMAAQIPIKNDPAANDEAMAKVRADKLREVTDGHDGTWVAHPGLVGMAKEIFDEHLKTPNQIATKKRTDVKVAAADLIQQPEGTRTMEGLRHNVAVAVQYLAAWLNGNGCVPLYNLMEDAATAEISRAQIWQWIRHGASLEDGTAVTPELVSEVIADELQQLQDQLPEERWEEGRYEDGSALFEQLSTQDELATFLTLPAYEILTVATRLTGAGAAYGVKDDEDREFEQTRFAGITRPYSKKDVDRLRGSFKIEYTLARRGARKLWKEMQTTPLVRALGALSGNQAVQMVRGGLRSIYCSGWQVAADNNRSLQTYPDQSLYPADSAPFMVQRLNNALLRADQIEHSEGGAKYDWVVPIVADAEAGFGGPLNAFELMKSMIEAGAAGVHFEDQLSSEKKCGHLGGKVLIPTGQFIRTLVAARLAADVMDVPTVLIARTDADSAKLLTSDIDPRDREFLTGERTSEGFFRIRDGIPTVISRMLSYAPYADLLWFETGHPDLDQARQVAEAVHAKYPGKMMAYNCSPSFNWDKLDQGTIAKFQDELGKMGYKYQFVTLAGFHALNLSMFDLARGYAKTGMTAYSALQRREFAEEENGYTATRHQREVGTGYFDEVRMVLSGGDTATSAMAESTEAEQF